MRYFLILLTLLYGCSKPAVEKPEKSDDLNFIQSKLSGLDESVQSQTTAITDQTDLLRHIKGVVEKIDNKIVEEPEPQLEENILVESVSYEDDVPDLYVIKFGSADCPPCLTWDVNEKPKLEAAGVKVVYIDTKNPRNRKIVRDYGVTSLPRFLIARNSTKKITHPDQYNQLHHYVGYFSADFFLKIINNDFASEKMSMKIEVVDDNSPHLDWIRARYNKNSILKADVSPRSDVWSHLTNHGFTFDGIKNLNEWDALCLHDAAHKGLIGKAVAE